MRYALLAFAIILGLVPATVAEESRTTIGVLTCTLAKATDNGANNVMCGFKALVGSAA